MAKRIARLGVRLEYELMHGNNQDWVRESNITELITQEHPCAFVLRSSDSNYHFIINSLKAMNNGPSHQRQARPGPITITNSHYMDGEVLELIVCGFYKYLIKVGREKTKLSFASKRTLHNG